MPVERYLAGFSRRDWLVETCDEAGVTLMTAYRLQTEPAVRRTREADRDGPIGEAVQAHAHFSNRILDHGGAGQWRLDPGLAGGGAIMNLGIDPLNTIRFLLDEDPDSVLATTATQHEAFEGVEEHAAFQLVFPSGMTASCTTSFHAHQASSLHLLGTEGRIRIEAPFGGYVPHDIHVEWGDVEMQYTDPVVDEVIEEFDYFANHVQTDRQPEPDGEDGVRDLEVIGAIYEAAERRTQVSL